MYNQLSECETYEIIAYCNNYEMTESDNIIPYLTKNILGGNNEITLFLKKETL